jgi:putative membrane protein
MMGFGFGGLGIVYMFIFWVAIIGLAVWLLSRLFPRETSNTSTRGTWRQTETPQSPLDIIQQRYARGEISKDEYEEMRRDLQK